MFEVYSRIAEAWKAWYWSPKQEDFRSEREEGFYRTAFAAGFHAGYEAYKLPRGGGRVKYDRTEIRRRVMAGQHDGEIARAMGCGLKLVRDVRIGRIG